MTDFSKKVYPAPNLDSRNRFHLSGENIRNASPAPSRQLNLGGARNSPNFSDGVYDVVRKIPRGRVVTYKDVAEAIGSPRAMRAVGGALHKNHSPEIPCHRVVCSSGEAGGYNRGRRAKIKILLSEGVKIQDGRWLYLNPARSVEQKI